MIGETEAKHLKKIRIKMYEDAMKAALKDGIITKDEQNLLETLKTTIDLDKRSIALIEAVLMDDDGDILKRIADVNGKSR